MEIDVELVIGGVMVVFVEFVAASIAVVVFVRGVVQVLLAEFFVLYYIHSTYRVCCNFQDFKAHLNGIVYYSGM